MGGWQLPKLTLYVECVGAGSSFCDGDTPRSVLRGWLTCASSTEGAAFALNAGHWRGGSRRLVLGEKIGIICNLLPRDFLLRGGLCEIQRVVLRMLRLVGAVVGVVRDGGEAEDSAELGVICCRRIACEDAWHATA